MTTTTRRGAAEAVGTQLLEGLTQQDWIAVDGCFDGNVCFRALTPRGLREATDRVAAAGYLRRWFGDATELHLVTSSVEAMHDRLSIRYRFRVHKDAWYVVEQQAYCDVVAGRITCMDLLCTGFRPDEHPLAMST